MCFMIHFVISVIIQDEPTLALHTHSTYTQKYTHTEVHTQKDKYANKHMPKVTLIEADLHATPHKQNIHTKKTYTQTAQTKHTLKDAERNTHVYT